MSQSTPPRAAASATDQDLDVEERLADLEAENRRLREELKEVKETTVNRTVVNQLVDHLLPGVDVEDFRAPIGPEAFGAAEDLAGMVQRHESIIEEQDAPTTDPKKEHWVECVAKAKNLEGNPNRDRRDGWVALYVDDVEGATGLSTRRCQDLVEELGDEYEGADWRGYEPPSASNKHNGRKKQLLVDLDVWGEDP